MAGKQNFLRHPCPIEVVVVENKLGYDVFVVKERFPLLEGYPFFSRTHGSEQANRHCCWQSAKPHVYADSLVKDLPHLGHLVVSLAYIELVDSQSIYPVRLIG